MALLSAEDRLPYRPSRVTVNGSSGAGKSTTARRIGEVLDLPYTEMDSLFHGPGWTPNPDFAEKVEAITSAPRWVCEFQYDAVRPMIADRADLVVWLDLPHRVTMWRLTRRTVGRRARGEELWNGNREAPIHTVLTDPEHLIRYAWTTRHDADARAHALLVSHAALPVVRLRSTREVAAWLRGPLVAAAGLQPRDQDGRR